MNEFLKNSIKNHSKGIGKTFLCHMLAVALSWAAFPLIFLLVARYMTIDSPLAILKKAAALVNENSGKLPHEKAELIASACDEILDGKLNEEFPLKE